jgi:hypothetical protein
MCLVQICFLFKMLFKHRFDRKKPSFLIASMHFPELFIGAQVLDIIRRLFISISLSMETVIVTKNGCLSYFLKELFIEQSEDQREKALTSYNTYCVFDLLKTESVITTNENALWHTTVSICSFVVILVYNMCSN